jgi:hypothetical protein
VIGFIGALVVQALETLERRIEEFTRRFVSEAFSYPLSRLFRSEARAYLRSVSFGQ